jgi:hypothetical protein
MFGLLRVEGFLQHMTTNLPVFERRQEFERDLKAWARFFVYDPWKDSGLMVLKNCFLIP